MRTTDTSLSEKTAYLLRQIDKVNHTRIELRLVADHLAQRLAALTDEVSGYVEELNILQEGIAQNQEKEPLEQRTEGVPYSTLEG